MTAGHGEPGFCLEDAVVLRETDRAVLVTAADLDAEMWVPKSVLHDDSEVWREGDEGTLVVQQWWADKNGLG